MIRLLVRGAISLGLACTIALFVRGADPKPESIDRHLKLQGGRSEVVLTGLSTSKIYSLALSLPAPIAIGTATLRIELKGDRGALTAKIIHRGDPDFYTLFRPRVDGPASLSLTLEGFAGVPLECDVRWIGWTRKGSDRIRLETEPNDTWQEANPIALGETIYATADDAPFIAVGAERETEIVNRGVDWYRLEVTDEKPRLVFFEIDLQERDNIPMDVSIYRLEGERPVPFESGIDPVSPPHEVQALPGNKFTTRILTRGAYFVRVAAGHPAYSLRTRIYDVPSYSDPRQAIRTAMDYLAAAGDSWHANTPRRGGIKDRVANYHAETSTCIACHATHFTTRANLVAHSNGYPIEMPRELQFLTERLYNNPRPFYGFPEASWSRLISASANVVSRLGALLNYFEHNISDEPRPALLRGVSEYLKLYYKGRETLPPDETNGNTPIVSTYEVAFYSWTVFDEMHRRTGDPEYAAFRDRLRKLLEQTQHKNLLDLCYQTIALATIDRETYRSLIQTNAERILSLQRSSGQWAMLFGSEAPEAEFQTGHCLYALALAGYSADDPRIAKGIRYLMGRQQSFGGWFDPLQSYENFRTPFRETQFAVMALSQFYKGPGAKGWGSGSSVPEKGLRLDAADGLGELLKGLDETWEKPAADLQKRIGALSTHQDALVRQAAVTALGRVGEASALPYLAQALSDPQKMVQINAAWALRQFASRKGLGFEEVLTGLGASSDRTRWGALRVFATHFSYLAGRSELARKVEMLMRDSSPVIRIQACKALWQWWYWTGDMELRESIENLFLERMAIERDPWVRRNLTEGFYNICDENVRYLYNNWIALLATPSDRERASGAHQASGTNQARKIAAAFSRARAVLDSGAPESERENARLLRDGILESLADFHLRKGDPAKPEDVPRIGNDIETIKFYAAAAAILEPEFARLLADADPAVRRSALRASTVLRGNPLPMLTQAWTGVTKDSDAEVRFLASRLARTLSMPGGANPATVTAEARKPASAPNGGDGKREAASTATPGSPDFGFFTQRVMPILRMPGSDGMACVQCHSTHTILRLNPPPREGDYTEEQLRENYRSALQVVNFDSPEESLILRKPLSTAESEGVAGSGRLSHGGGVRWPGKDSEAYLTILEWIRGAKTQ